MRLWAVLSVVWFAGCGGSQAELRCVSDDGSVLVNERHSCADYCDIGVDLVTIAQGSCADEPTCGCAFNPDEACEEWLEGRECQL